MGESSKLTSKNYLKDKYAMWFSRPKKINWQILFIKDMFKSVCFGESTFGKLAINNIQLVNSKGVHLPSRLFKFYSPTQQNIDDIRNKMLWLSDPNKFNDPFECKIGYDEKKYEKSLIVQFYNDQTPTPDADKNKILTKDDINRIKNSKLGELKMFDTKNETYNDAIYGVLKEKEKDLEMELYNFFKKRKQEVNVKLDLLKQTNIRIACFANLDYLSFDRQISMWAHYADNHKGFCVEYDVSRLKEDIALKSNYSAFYSKESREDYLNERINIILKAGLFPVCYSSKRVNIPVTMLINSADKMVNKLARTRSLNELIFKTYVTKSPVWNYEKEWRLIVDNKISDYYDHKIPFPFIKAIYIGYRAEADLIDRLKLIGDELKIDVYHTEMDGGTFSLNSFKHWHSDSNREFKKNNDPYL